MTAYLSSLLSERDLNSIYDTACKCTGSSLAAVSHILHTDEALEFKNILKPFSYIVVYLYLLSLAYIKFNGHINIIG